MSILTARSSTPRRAPRETDGVVNTNQIQYMTFPRGTVLLVQEDVEIRARLRERLRRVGFDAWYAWSYPEALVTAPQVEPRVVLVELDRLEGGSIRFVSDLLAILPGTSIALVTASVVSAASLRIRVAGAAEVFVRPFQVSALDAWLDEQLAAEL